MDELAARLNIDPVEFRIKNYALVDQRSGRPYSAKHLEECYRLGSNMIGWQKGRNMPVRQGNRLRALGMASQTWGGGGAPPAYAWVRLNSDGTVEVIVGSQDIGTGTKTVFAQIAAEEFDLDPEQVSVCLGDTENSPYGPVSSGSMTVSSVGPAIRQAAIDARNQLCDIASGYLDVPAEQIEIRQGAVYIRNSNQSLAISDITGNIGEFTILGKGSREPNSTDIELRTYGAQFADVEVDTVTGDIIVHKVVSVHDFGRVINPLGSRSQVEGAVIQGIGYALTEGRLIDPGSGVVLNPNLEEYLVPVNMDINGIDSAFIDRPDVKANHLGAKGLGEPPMVPTAPAICNAIARATGIRFLSLPVNRSKFLEGMRKYNTGGGIVP